MSKRRTQKTNSLDSDEVLEEPADELDYGQISACKEEHASPGHSLLPEQFRFISKGNQKVVERQHCGEWYQFDACMIDTLSIILPEAARVRRLSNTLLLAVSFKLVNTFTTIRSSR